MLVKYPVTTLSFIVVSDHQEMETEVNYLHLGIKMSRLAHYFLVPITKNIVVGMMSNCVVHYETLFRCYDPIKCNFVFRHRGRS